LFGQAIQGSFHFAREGADFLYQFTLNRIITEAGKMEASLTVEGRKNSKKLNLGGNNVAQKKKKWGNIVEISTFRR